MFRRVQRVDSKNLEPLGSIGGTEEMSKSGRRFVERIGTVSRRNFQDSETDAAVPVCTAIESSPPAIGFETAERAVKLS